MEQGCEGGPEGAFSSACAARPLWSTLTPLTHTRSPMHEAHTHTQPEAAPKVARMAISCWDLPRERPMQPGVFLKQRPPHTNTLLPDSCESQQRGMHPHELASSAKARARSHFHVAGASRVDSRQLGAYLRQCTCIFAGCCD